MYTLCNLLQNISFRIYRHNFMEDIKIIKLFLCVSPYIVSENSISDCHILQDQAV